MNKRIRRVGTFLIVLIIFVAMGAMHIVHSTTVDCVEGVSAKIQNNNQAEIKWRNMPSADGYYVFKSENGSDYEKVTINKPDATSYVAEDLQQATVYDFYVIAYKNFLGKTYVGEEYKKVSTFTVPSKQELTNCYSNDKGIINVSWTSNPNATGYQLKYCLVDGAAASEAVAVIEDNKTVNYSVSSLLVGKKYTVSVASYMDIDGKIVSGEYSDEVTIVVSDKVEMSKKLDPDKPMVALTFDDGPSYGSVTDDILDVLSKHKARATFFMVGVNVTDNKSTLKRKIKLGCELGNHTNTHERYGKQLKTTDISKCSKAIYNACGQYPTAFRSTGGITNSKIRKTCKNQGLPLYYWSIDTLDWQVRDAEKIYSSVMDNVKDGDIILMHDIYPETAEAVKRMVPDLIKQGYQLVTVSELVTAKTGKSPKAGQQYLDGDTIKNNT